MSKSVYNVEHSFDLVYEKLISKIILDEQVSGDLPIYIQAYPAEHSDAVNSQIRFLHDRLNKNGVPTLHFNIYDIALEILKSANKMDLILSKESLLPKEKLHITLNSMLREKAILDFLNNALKEIEPKLVLLSGFGLVYPYIRANTILNNIEPLARGASFVFFYPGRYNNESLVLFDKIKEDNYYRAHNLETITI